MKRAGLFGLFAVIVVMGCHSKSSIDPQPKPIDPEKAAFRKAVPKVDKTQLAAVSQATNQFSLSLLKQLMKDHPDSNLVVLTMGVAQNFTMLHECAAGAFRADSEKLLNVKNLSSDALASFHSAFLNDLESDPYQSLQMANSIWLRETYKTEPEATKKLDALFGCSVQHFSSDIEKAKQEMGKWISDNTQGAIKELKTPIDDQTESMLINALSFNGRWVKEFDPSRTSKEVFKTPTGDIEADFMFASERECHAIPFSDDLIAIELPFLGSRYTFVAVAPSEGAKFKSLLPKLNSKGFKAILGRIKETKVNVYFPKLDLHTEISLLESIRLLAGSDWGERVDLSKLARGAEGLFINSVLQNAMLKLDENGVTVKAVVETEVMKDEPSEIRFDRPFVYFILHKPSGTIVVCGVVNDPTKS